MAYDKFNILTSTAVPLSIENVDTDQIIPARFLKATERVGFGDNLFRDWRYNNDDSPKLGFVQITLPTVETSLEEETLALDLQENTCCLGLWFQMWYPAFLLIF
jgi:3-isopropylmalate dehydratase small subunit